MPNVPMTDTPREAVLDAQPDMPERLRQFARWMERLPSEYNMQSDPALLDNAADLIARLRTELAAISERTVGDVGDAITSAEGGMLWTDDAVNRIVANATRQSQADAERWRAVSKAGLLRSHIEGDYDRPWRWLECNRVRGTKHMTHAEYADALRSPERKDA